jgi:hypothetical protein
VACVGAARLWIDRGHSEQGVLVSLETQPWAVLPHHWCVVSHGVTFARTSVDLYCQIIFMPPKIQLSYHPNLKPVPIEGAGHPNRHKLAITAALAALHLYSVRNEQRTHFHWLKL